MTGEKKANARKKGSNADRRSSKIKDTHTKIRDLLDKSGLSDRDKHDILHATIEEIAEKNLVMLPHMESVLLSRSAPCGGANPVFYRTQPDGSCIKYCLQPDCSYVPCGTYPNGCPPVENVG